MTTEMHILHSICSKCERFINQETEAQGMDKVLRHHLFLSVVSTSVIYQPHKCRGKNDKNNKGSRDSGSHRKQRRTTGS